MIHILMKFTKKEDDNETLYRKIPDYDDGSNLC